MLILLVCAAAAIDFRDLRVFGSRRGRGGHFKIELFRGRAGERMIKEAVRIKNVINRIKKGSRKGCL